MELFKGDCRIWMEGKEEMADLIIADPPFGIGFGSGGTYNRNSGKVVGAYVDVLPEGYRDFMKSWLINAARVLKETGSIYVFSGWNRLGDVLGVAKEASLVQIGHVIWKYQFGVYAERKPVCSHEHVLLFCKSRKRYYFNRLPDMERKAAYRYREDVWDIKRRYVRGETTPNRFPPALCEKMVNLSSKPRDLVVDLFMGSGQVGVAALGMGRDYVGCETNEARFDFAGRNLKSVMEG